MAKKDAPSDVAPLPEFAGLTPAEVDILLTLVEAGLGKVDLTKGPEKRINKTKLAEVAGVDRRTVLRAFQNETFVDAYNKICLALVRERVGEVLEASIREAKRQSFQDRQMLLQMAGLFTPTNRSEVTGKDGKPVQIETIVGLVREAIDDNPGSGRLDHS
ncbi:MAG: hypothetical protein M3Q03_21055 [Chloroflexota bacterium]|nr:hypothetical protein [Chloroflexota bacterium]